MIPPTSTNSTASRTAALKRAAVIVGVAFVVAVPGMLALRFWPAHAASARPAQAPPASPAAATPGCPSPLASFDVRAVGTGATRIKLWVTPPGGPAAYGVEFSGKGADLRALVQRRGAAERTPVPVPAGWADRINAAVRRSAENPTERGISADLVVEYLGEVPQKYEVRFDPEGAGWAVLDEILSHYGLLNYTVKRGDTPSGIARKVLGDARRWSDILAVNPGLKPDKLKPGDVIRVPRK